MTQSSDIRTNVACDCCNGAGEIFGHAPGCDSDYCALAGGIDDCDGEVQICPDCAGSGESVADQKCGRCDGSGGVQS